uniref:Uncharacterized protein n=1 Tax=Myotis myotis TaxID=51298 RepID=A0A7J7QSM8_MYOMY|nr:hypothetical protein mMyoMyo1_011849 [Myotis myotis]
MVTTTHSFQPFAFSTSPSEQTCVSMEMEASVLLRPVLASEWDTLGQGLTFCPEGQGIRSCPEQSELRSKARSWPSPVVGKLISQQSQIPTALLQNRPAPAESRLLRMGHEVSIALYVRPRGILWKSHTQGAKEPPVALEPQFAAHSPSQLGSVDRASACGLKGLRFDSGRGHRPGLWAWSPVGGVREAADP